MQITRKGYYTIEYDGELLKKPDGSTRQATTRDDCYEYISEDGRSGIFTIYSPNREVEVPVINVPGVSVNPVGPNVIWETTFANDADYSHTDNGNWSTSSVPTGWDGVKAVGTSALTIQNTGGVGGSKAMRLSWAPSSESAQPTLSMGKHLTGNISTGYSELYIRYHVKFPNGFRMGSPDSSPTPNTASYWKWGRLWQNTSPTNGSTWNENRVDSKYVVWNWKADNPSVYGCQVAMACGANTGSNLHLGSSGGEHYVIRFLDTGSADYTSEPGFFQNMSGWELDWDGDADGDFIDTTTQGWHTIEYHFQLKSGSTYGKYEVFFDGVLQDGATTYKDVNPTNGAAALDPNPEQTLRVIETELDTSGWNFFTCFDNMVDWNDDWDTVGVEGWVDLNDIVISTTRIGHSYVATDDGSG